MEGNQRYGWGYLPFNRGPRICLGQKFALTEIGYAVVRMVQEFEGLDGRGLGEWREKMGMTMACEGGVRVGMRRRKTKGG